MPPEVANRNWQAFWALLLSAASETLPNEDLSEDFYDVRQE